MYKQLLTGGFAIALLASMGLPVKAQTAEPGTAPPGQEMPQGQEAPKTDVSSEDLQKFASAVKQIQTIQQSYQGKMAQAVEAEGLTQQRYMEIQQAQANPSAQPSSEISSEDKQKYEQANNKVAELEQQAETEMKQAVQSQGLDIQRFNEIFAAIQQDPSLQQQVREMIQK